MTFQISDLASPGKEYAVARCVEYKYSHICLFFSDCKHM